MSLLLCILSLEVSTPILLVLSILPGVSPWAGVSSLTKLWQQTVSNRLPDYVFQWAIVLPLELVVASFTVGYWNEDINVAVWITLFLAFIVIINVFGVLGYAEEEFWSSVLKLAAIVIFMIVGLILGSYTILID